jgi:hypothetical protein
VKGSWPIAILNPRKWHLSIHHCTWKFHWQSPMCILAESHSMMWILYFRWQCGIVFWRWFSDLFEYLADLLSLVPVPWIPNFSFEAFGSLSMRRPIAWPALPKRQICCSVSDGFVHRPVHSLNYCSFHFASCQLPTCCPCGVHVVTANMHIIL